MTHIEPRSEDNLQQDLKRVQHQLDTLRMITSELATELNFEKLLKRVAVKAREIIDAEALVIPIIDEERKHYTYMAAEGRNSTDILGQHFAVGVGMCGWVLIHQKPLIFAENMPWSMDEKTQWEVGMESALLVPLIARGEIIGGLSGLGKQGGKSFTAEDLDILKAFASQVSIAIDNARIFRELSEEKERTLTTLNSIGDGVIVTDTAGVITRINPVACQLLGETEHEILGQPLENVFRVRNPDAITTDVNPVARVLETGQQVELTRNAILQDKQGREYRIADSAAPIKDSEGAMHGVILVFHDVTEEYKLLENLRSSEQRYRRLIEHLGDEFFMFTQNVTSGLNFVSPSIRRCLGYSPEEFIENYKNYLTSDPLNDIIEERFNEAMQGIRPDSYEIEMLHKNGEVKRLRVSKTPVFGDSNNVIAIEGLVQDITQQRALEASLRQSQKLEAIGQLSGGIAHDFNNQLGIVMGYLDMLEEGLELQPNQSRWLGTAKKSTQRCIELTQSLMNFSRKKLASQSIINLNECLQSMQSILEHALTPVIEFSMQLDEGASNVVADAGEFQDVMLNLAINARDAMPSGGRLLLQTQSVRFDEEYSCYLNVLMPGRYIKIIIQDSGSGMSPDLLSRIFEPFFTTKPTGQGTGLGMPMVFGFINRVKGGIDVHTVEGEGTCFELYIPQVKHSAIPGEQSSGVADLPRGHEHILLVEDEPALRDLAKQYLTGLGYRVTEAENAIVAKQQLEEGLDPQLLFSDVVMPGGMDGFQLAAHVRECFPEIKILMATGYASRQSASNSPSERKEEIIYKPYSRAILARRIHRVLETTLNEDFTG